MSSVVTRQNCIALALVMAAAGCSGLFAASSSSRGCRSDADCRADLGQVCRTATGASIAPTATEQGICVTPSGASHRQVYLEVLPVGAQASTPVQIGPIDLANGQNQKLVVPLPVDATGSIFDALNDTPVDMAALQFVSVPLIPYRPQTFQATSGAGGLFSQLLPQGQYTITVQPPNGTQGAPPPQQFPQVAVDSTGQISPLQVADPNTLIYVSGTLQSAVPSGTAQPTFQPIVGASVTAIGPKSTVPLSQTVQTDSSGGFRLGLLPPPLGTGVFPIRLQIAPSTSGSTLPTFTYGDDSNVIDALYSAALAVNLVLPGPLVTVSGRVIDPNANPVGGMIVTFRTTADASTVSGKFSYTATATTANDGSFQVQLVPANYTAVAVPPASSLTASQAPAGTDTQPYASMGLCGVTSMGNVSVVQVAPAAPPLVTLACESRQTVSGIVTFHGAAISGAQVDVYRQPSAELPAGLHLQATTAADGTFSLQVVSGTYDVNIAPPDGSGLAYLWAPAAFQVGPNHPGQEMEPFNLPESFQLFGSLVAAGTNTPVEALIDAYPADSSSTMPVGHGHAGADGKYSIVLPAATVNETPSMGATTN